MISSYIQSLWARLNHEVIPIGVVLCILVISSGCSSVQPFEYTAENITHQFIQHQNQVKDYSATVVKMVHSQKINVSDEIVEILVKRPFLCRVVVRQGSYYHVNGTIFLRNKSMLSVYIPQQNEYQVIPLDRGGGSNLDDYDFQTETVRIIQEYPIVYDGMERTGDRSAFVIEANLTLSRISPIFNHIKAWIDTETWMVLRTETIYESPDPTRVTEYSNIDVNTGVPDSVFDFVPPVGAHPYVSPVIPSLTIPPGFFDKMREVPTSTPPGGIPLPMQTPGTP
jgi:outer membrane lipoprotein-sorting protein